MQHNLDNIKEAKIVLEKLLKRRILLSEFNEIVEINSDEVLKDGTTIYNFDRFQVLNQLIDDIDGCLGCFDFIINNWTFYEKCFKIYEEQKTKKQGV